MLTIGFELELEFGSDEHAFEDALPDLVSYAQYRGWADEHTDDGSLNNGIELRSRVRTYAAWRACTALPVWLERARAEGFRAYDTTTCGFHVHVGRAGLSPQTLLRVYQMLHDTPNIPFWKLLSQRRTFDYCHFDQLNWTYCQRNIDRVLRDDDPLLDRYLAVNLPTHHPTIEFRLWRGTLSWEGVMRRVGASHAIVTYAASEAVDLSWEAWVAWVQERATEYPELCAWFERKVDRLNSLREVVRA